MEHIVYVKLDAEGRIIAVNSSAWLVDAVGWTEIDRGFGDRYLHAMGNYCPEPIFTDDGLCRYKLNDGRLTLRTENEIAADRAPQLAEAQRTALTAELRGTDARVLEALEGLLTATTPTDFIAALVAAADRLKDTLADRAKLRAEIKALAGKED